MNLMMNQSRVGKGVSMTFRNLPRKCVKCNSRLDFDYIDKCNIYFYICPVCKKKYGFAKY